MSDAITLNHRIGELEGKLLRAEAMLDLEREMKLTYQEMARNLRARCIELENQINASRKPLDCVAINGCKVDLSQWSYTG